MHRAAAVLLPRGLLPLLAAEVFKRMQQQLPQLSRLLVGHLQGLPPQQALKEALHGILRIMRAHLPLAGHAVERLPVGPTQRVQRRLCLLLRSFPYPLQQRPPRGGE